MTRVAPKPIEYSKRRKKTTFRGVSRPLKRTELTYAAELLEMLRFLTETGGSDQYSNIENSKLYTIIRRILLISDSSDPEAVEYRIKSFKCLKDFIENLLLEYERVNNQIRYNIISFLFQMTQIAKILVHENTNENLMNKEAFFIMMIQISQPLDRIYKLLRISILRDTKG